MILKVWRLKPELIQSFRASIREMKFINTIWSTRQYVLRDWQKAVNKAASKKG